MPAAAASTATSRKRHTVARRDAKQQNRRGSLWGAGTSSGKPAGAGFPPHLNSVTGSSINLRGSSQRNFVRPHPPSVRGEERLADSLPALNEMNSTRNYSARSGDIDLDDSVRTNPELFLSNDHKIENADSLNIQSRHRLKTQYEEEGEPRNEATQHRLKTQYEEEGEGEQRNETIVQRGPQNVQQPGTARALNHLCLKSAPEQPKGHFDENTGLETSANVSNKKWWPLWMDPLCHIRLFAGRTVNDSRVQNAILLLILINSTMMGVATFPPVKHNPNLMRKFDTADEVFLVIFTIESSLQLMYYGWSLLKDGFLVFDLLIVVMSWALEGTQVFRAFRIFRAMRLITRIKTLRNLVMALISVIPKMTAIAMLLFLIFYIFSVMFTQLFKNMYSENLVEEPYFDTLFYSLFTLFQMMTLDEWAEILYQIQATYPWAWAPFGLFIVLTGFVVVNLIIAVICDAVHVLAYAEKVALQGCESDCSPSKAMDTNSNGSISEHVVPILTTEQKLELLQLQLDEMIVMQDQMSTTIEVLVRKIRENSLRGTNRESESFLIQTDSWEQLMCSSTPQSTTIDLLEEEVSRLRISPTLIDSASSSLYLNEK